MAEFGFTFHLLLYSLLEQIFATLCSLFLIRSMKEAKCDLPNVLSTKRYSDNFLIKVHL